MEKKKKKKKLNTAKRKKKSLEQIFFDKAPKTTEQITEMRS